MRTATTENKIVNVYSYLRFSSEPQSWGDSERRQNQLALDWCRRNGRNLSERTFADRGVSGWRGDNRKTGALGALLKVAGKGDTILIEDTDRWSREAPLDSLNALRDTVRRGVEVVFLKTGVRVTADNFNDPATLFPAFFGSFLANSENEKRSFRVREAMKERRANMEAGIAVAGRCPAWLDWDIKAEVFVVNEQKAKVVRRIFDLCLAGHGTRAIEYQLREEKLQPITARDTYSKLRTTWTKTTIQRLLNNKAVLGIHPATGTKVYPAIVPEEVFYVDSQKLKARQTFTVRRDAQDKNLFTGLCVCAECGSSYIRRFDKGYSYLVCSGALRHTTKCSGLGLIKYPQFEASFLALLSYADLIEKALAFEKGPSKLDALRGELADVQRQCEKYMRFINDDENPSKRVMENLKMLESKESQLQKEIEVEEVKAKWEIPVTEAYDRFQADLAAHAQEPEYRARVREALRDVVEKITIDGHGSQKTYQVRLRTAAIPIDVILGPGGWLFNPAPRCVLQECEV